MQWKKRRIHLPIHSTKFFVLIRGDLTNRNPGDHQIRLPIRTTITLRLLFLMLSFLFYLKKRNPLYMVFLVLININDSMYQEQQLQHYLLQQLAPLNLALLLNLQLYFLALLLRMQRFSIFYLLKFEKHDFP